MSSIIINDIFEEVIEENRRLLNELIFADKYIKVLNDFKSFADLVFDKIKLNLDLNDSQKYKDLVKSVENVLKENINCLPKKSEVIDNCSTSGSQRRPKISPKKRSKKTTESEDKPYLPLKSEVIDNSSDEESEDNSKLKKLLTIRAKKSINSQNKTYLKRRPIDRKKRDLFNTNVKREENSSKDEFFVCDFDDCGQQFESQYKLNYHKWKSHKPEVYVCDYPGCGYQCKAWHRLRDHKRTHTGERPHECSECGKRFITKNYVKEHIKQTHQISAEPLVCGLDNCEKQFKTEFHLSKHKKIYHLSEKRFVCHHNDCEFKASTKGLYLKHLKSHTNDRPFKCQIEGCDKTYKLNSELTLHLKTHTSERNFKCPHEGCEKTFKTDFYLTKHVRLSHWEKKYVCEWPGCEYRTSQNNVLISHMKVHTNELDFPCIWPQCEKVFRSKKNMRQHLKTHKGDKPFVCHWPGCQYRSIHSWTLRHHIEAHQRS